MSKLTGKELKTLRDSAKSDIFNAGHGELFSDSGFIAFWERFWNDFAESPVRAFATRDGMIKTTYVKQLGGIVLGLYLAETFKSLE